MPAATLESAAEQNTTETPDPQVTSTPPAGEQETQVQDTGDSGTESVQDTGDAGEANIDESFLTNLASDEGLNLEDPADRAMAERMAKRELKLREAATEGTQEEVLTEFERSLLEPDEQTELPDRQRQTERPKTEDRQQRDQNGNNWNLIQDRGRDWKDWGDGYKAELEELSRIGQDIEAGRQPDLRNITEIRTAQNRRVIMEALPIIQQIVAAQMGQQFQAQFGDAMPAINEVTTAARVNRAKQSAIADLASTKEFKDIRTMTKPGQGEITFIDPQTRSEEKFSDTPLNRVLVKNPGLLRIKVDHKDPETAMRLTMTEIYRQAARMIQHQSVQPNNAQQLLKAGKAMEQKKQQDRTRQTLNAGSGATSRGGSKGDDFLASQIGGSKFSKLFNK